MFTNNVQTNIMDKKPNAHNAYTKSVLDIKNIHSKLLIYIEIMQIISNKPKEDQAVKGNHTTYRFDTDQFQRLPGIT